MILQQNNMCIDTQDFEEIVDSSIIEGYPPIFHKSGWHYEKKDDFDMRHEPCTSVKFNMEYRDQFNTIKENQNFSTLSNNMKSFDSQKQENFVKPKTAGMQMTRMQYLYHLITSEASDEDKNVIIRHQNGEI
jgi:hypothetical protein